MLVAAILTDAEYRAKLLHDACSGAGTTDHILIDVICTATSSMLAATKVAFKGLFATLLIYEFLKNLSSLVPQGFGVRHQEGNIFQL